jgi:hypothetical protein
MTTSNVYRNPRPTLVIEHAGGKRLGPCCYAYRFRVTALERLSHEQLDALYQCGLLGMGQTFSVRSPCDGNEKPTGLERVGCVTVDLETQQVVADPAINPYTGVSYEPTLSPYFVYECETCCDSGD